MELYNQTSTTPCKSLIKNCICYSLTVPNGLSARATWSYKLNNGVSSTRVIMICVRDRLDYWWGRLDLRGTQTEVQFFPYHHLRIHATMNNNDEKKTTPPQSRRAGEKYSEASHIDPSRIAVGCFLHSTNDLTLFGEE